VDDSTDLREILRFFLEKKNFEVIEASDGREAMEALRRHKPDCVVLDLLMPIQDGYVTLEEIRANEYYRDLPVLVLTSLGREANIIRAFKLGASDFLKKPFSPEELYFRIIKMLPADKREMLELDQ
jgi:DNA-binding response OmpR family regulator